MGLIIDAAYAVGVPILSGKGNGKGVVVEVGVVDEGNVCVGVGRVCNVGDGGGVGRGDVNVVGGIGGNGGAILVEDRPSFGAAVVPNTNDVIVIDTGGAVGVPHLGGKDDGVGIAIGEGVIDEGVVAKNVVGSGEVGEVGTTVGAGGA